ncbi:MAG TPA: SDR family NAD(P)-dependent oxidoreductase, partial [Gaiellaceae bacterium]|nr:SDR family NAD(P)-dependent oxidoreductase [Gaiellaceae bacterium]
MGARAPPVLQARALDRVRARLRPRAPRGGGGIPSALVTGASTGIGAATARWLAARGWDVHASVRRAGEAPEGTRELVFDVTDADAVGAAAAALDRLDALVNNAGIAIAAPLEFLPPDELARQLDVNVVGQVRVTQAFLPALRAARGR